MSRLRSSFWALYIFLLVDVGLCLFCCMPFKVSNETKVGALTAITITLFILGFNFMKGKNPLKKTNYFYARFESIEGVAPSNPVKMSGLQIGAVYATAPSDELLSSILVTIRLTENIKIPSNSVVQINSDLLGSSAIEIVKGDAKTYLKPGDTIAAINTPGFFGGMVDKLTPTQKKLEHLLVSIDSVASKLNNTITAREQQNMQQLIGHLSDAAASLKTTIGSVNSLLDTQNGSVAKTMANLETASGALAANKEKINNIADNLSTATKKLSDLNLQNTLDELSATLTQLQTTLAKVNSKDGTVGMLLTDKKAYDNLNQTLNSLNLLMQDLRLHPKRYVSVSVFGKKDKSEPLMKPLATDSITQEQRKN